MRNVAAWLTLGGIALALGCIVTSVAVVLPALDAGGDVDPNLARAWVAPMVTQLALWVLAASATVAVAAPRWLSSATASTLGLAAAALAIADRAVVVPRLVDAWSLVDLGRHLPAANMREVEMLTRVHQATSATTVVLLAVVLVIAVRRMNAAGPPAAVVA